MQQPHSIPHNPLIDGVHYGTAVNIAHVLEFAASSEDVQGGLYLTLKLAADAARYLADALKPDAAP
ncbi:MAG: hypothetical protein WAT67_01405 [Candidatus Contendobacter sp.]